MSNAVLYLIVVWGFFLFGYGIFLNQKKKPKNDGLIEPMTTALFTALFGAPKLWTLWVTIGLFLLSNLSN